MVGCGHLASRFVLSPNHQQYILHQLLLLMSLLLLHSAPASTPPDLFFPDDAQSQPQFDLLLKHLTVPFGITSHFSPYYCSTSGILGFSQQFPSANSTITSTRSQLSASLHILSPSAPKVAQLKENHLSRQEYTYPLRHHVLNSHGCNIPKEGSVELHLYPYIALWFALRLLWSGDPLCKRMRQGSVLGEHVSAVYTVRHCCMLSSKPHKRHHCRMILIE